MKKLLFTFFMLITTNVVILSQNQIPQLIKQIEKSVFTVLSIDENDNEFSQGSGFFISSNGIGVTNYHVLDGAYNAKIKLSTGEIIPIESICDYDKNADIVIFKVKSNNLTFPALRLTNVIPTRGTSIISLSSPLGLEQTASTGIVSAVRDSKNYGKIIQITAPISHGSSGSPIVNLNGEVLGVSTFGFESGQNLNFAVSSLKIRELSQVQNISLYDMWNKPLETMQIRKAVKLRNQGLFKESIDILQNEINTNPQNHLALYELGMSLYENDADGIEYLIKACALDSMNFVYWNGLGLHASSLNDQMKGNKNYAYIANYAYGRALELNPNSSDTYYNSAVLNYKCVYIYHIIDDMRLLDLALAGLSQAINLNPCALYYTVRARVYVAKKNIGAALLDCDKAISLDPEFSEPYFVRGDAKAFELSDYYGGLADIEKALALVDYNYPKLSDLKYHKSDMLGIKGTIYNHLMTREEKTEFWTKINESFDEAYKLNPDKIYMERKAASYLIYQSLLEDKK